KGPLGDGEIPARTTLTNTLHRIPAVQIRRWSTAQTKRSVTRQHFAPTSVPPGKVTRPTLARTGSTEIRPAWICIRGLMIRALRHRVNHALIRFTLESRGWTT